MADNLERAGTDESAWYDAIQLDDAQTAVLKQYDDLVWERVRWLRDHAGENAATLADAVNELQAAIDQRADLLLRGRAAPAAAPGALLQAPQSTPESAALVALALSDAVTHDGNDYLVDGLATSFSDGQTWKLAHLVPSGAGAGENWLSISPAGLELAWLEAIPAPELGSKQIVFHDSVLDFVDARSSIVQVGTVAGVAPDVLVRTWNYSSGPLHALVEQWPDGAIHAYAGHALPASDLEVWPATHTQEVANTP